MLCAGMKELYCRRYGVREESVLVVGNLALRSAAGELDLESGFLGLETHAKPRAGGRISVGYLGALSVEKGFDLFAEVENRTRSLRDGPEVVFECAGLLGDKESEHLVRARSSLGYQGVLGGEQVSSFLSRQTLILFPSRYANEAQPNVIIEALHGGVPVLATRRGCIPDLLGPHLEEHVVAEEAFVDHAVSLIERLMVDDVFANELQEVSAAQYRSISRRAVAQVEAWKWLVQSS
jgi:glycosyltransferase involved in cell wall biosynthesis